MRIVRGDALKSAPSLSSAEARFDVVFLDPPFRQGWLERLTPLLPGLLADDGDLYVEAEHELDGLGEWQTVRRGRAGQVFYHLMRSKQSDGTE